MLRTRRAETRRPRGQSAPLAFAKGFRNSTSLGRCLVRSARARAAARSGWWSRGSCATTSLFILKAESDHPARCFRRDRLLVCRRPW
eukprot:4712339-Pyramimonas_sp.AAC.1